jgi:putative intracellular protease/amidase
MSGEINVTDPDQPKKILIVVANPATSSTLGIPVGFWGAELTHAWHAFTEAGYEVTIASPDGGKCELDAWSDPRDESKYSFGDLITMGFLNTPEYLRLIENTPALSELNYDDYDALVVVGGQSPMFTFRDHEELKNALRTFYEAGKVTSALCHGTAALIDVTLSDGSVLIAGKTMTGFANVEEDFADEYVGRQVMALALRGRGQRTRGKLHSGRSLQALRRPRRPPDHRPTAVLRRRSCTAGDRSSRQLTEMGG